MKRLSSPPVKVPRLNSLLHRLQKAKTKKPDDEPYLDELMLFLDEPPDGVKNRWKVGAEMCSAWGIATTDTSVWRLYHSHLIEWRVRVALKIGEGEIEPEALAQKTAQMIGLRTYEMLNNPRTPPAALVSLMRVDLRQKALELARQKQRYHELTSTDRALAELKRQAGHDRYAQFAHKELTSALAHKASRYRDIVNAPYIKQYQDIYGQHPDDSPSSPDPVISAKQTPNMP